MTCHTCGCGHELMIRQGDDYTKENGNQFCFDSRGCRWPDNMADEASLVFEPVSRGCGCPFNSRGLVTGTITKDDCGVYEACFDIPCAETNAMACGKATYRWKLMGKGASGGPITLDSGYLTVLP